MQMTCETEDANELLCDNKNVRLVKVKHFLQEIWNV